MDDITTIYLRNKGPNVRTKFMLEKFGVPITWMNDGWIEFDSLCQPIRFVPRTYTFDIPCAQEEITFYEEQEQYDAVPMENHTEYIYATTNRKIITTYNISKVNYVRAVNYDYSGCIFEGKNIYLTAELPFPNSYCEVNYDRGLITTDLSVPSVQTAYRWETPGGLIIGYEKKIQSATLYFTQDLININGAEQILCHGIYTGNIAVGITPRFYKSGQVEIITYLKQCVPRGLPYDLGGYSEFVIDFPGYWFMQFGIISKGIDEPLEMTKYYESPIYQLLLKEPAVYDIHFRVGTTYYQILEHDRDIHPSPACSNYFFKLIKKWTLPE